MNGTWPVPSNADPSTVRVQARGESGAGGTSSHGVFSGGGSGGGGYGEEPALGGLVPGSTTLTITVPQGGTGQPTTVTGGAVTVQANAGTSASGQTAGTGGAASGNTIAYRGGNGATGLSGATQNGAGGGGSAGPSGAGGDASGTAGGAAGAGGGVAGASGAGTSNPGTNGTAPGGGASGGGSATSFNHTGGNGAAGQVTITWSLLTWSATGYASATAVMATAKKAVSGFRALVSFTGAPLPVRPVNQWSATFAQPAAFGNMPPALQSSVVALTPATSVGGGSGVPTAGNWLFCVAGWNQAGMPSATVADADDIHSFWRPGDVTKSQWAVSPSAASTRTSVWYVPNLARSPGDVYIAPTGAMNGRACLVIEVAGLGPWDTVTGIYANYAAAATALNLTLGAPSGPAFILAAACGDSTAATQALAPAGWTALQAVSASNGADHSCDAVLTSACISTAGSVSVNATAGTATDLSGVIIGVLTAAPSPVPAGANKAWAGRSVLEMAWGSGYETPPDQMQWTVVSDSAWTSWQQGWKRFWSMSDTSGVPYALGQLQASEGSYQLDNFEGALSTAQLAASGPWSFATSGTPSTGSYFTVTAAQAASVAVGNGFWDTLNPGTQFVVTSVGAPSGGLVNVSFTPPAATVMSGDTVTQVNPETGVPVRLRMAIGTIGGVTCNQWYTWQRNALSWPEKRNRALRGFVELTTSDVWSVVSGSGPTPYRGEVQQDAPGWWWPCDDQPGEGGVLPLVLRNAASGSSVPLSIIASPNGIGTLSPYSTGGVNLGGVVLATPSIATYNVAQQQGWMYGDPQASPQSAQTGNPVTAQPGSAAWQQAGQLGSGGANGWFLAAHDPAFPALSAGVTAEGWFDVGFSGSAQGYKSSTTNYQALGQPYSPITLIALATATQPVAVAQLDMSGHLTVTTYNAGVSNGTVTVYSASDLRCNAFICVTLTLTATGWACYLNGGISAAASGSATIGPSAWSWLTACGDLGSGGGSNLAGIVHGGNMYVSHLAVYPRVLPPARILAHYAAAVAGFGLIPAPTTLAGSLVANNTPGSGYTPDGSEYQGNYGLTGGNASAFAVSAVAAAVIGSYTSGPSARATVPGIGQLGSSAAFGNALWASWNSLSPLVQLFTAASANAETEAAACLGEGDAFTAGYGSGAAGAGVCQVSAGTGASPPAAPSALGDTVAQRLERILGYAGITAPRAIDPAPLQVQAASDIGGQQAGANLTNIQQSDSGWLYVDGNGTLCYRQRPHLQSDTVTWRIGMDTQAGQVPFAGDIEYDTDPQRVYTVIQVSPYSPDGATLPVLEPANATAVNAAQRQYGPRPLTVTSYLQSAAEQQAQADWYFATYGSQAAVRRIRQLTIDAASHPAAWGLVLGINIADVCQVSDTPMGAPAMTGTYRVSRIRRTLGYGANGSQVTASVQLALDPLPPSGYWT